MLAVPRHLFSAHERHRGEYGVWPCPIPVCVAMHCVYEFVSIKIIPFCPFLGFLLLNCMRSRNIPCTGSLHLLRQKQGLLINVTFRSLPGRAAVPHQLFIYTNISQLLSAANWLLAAGVNEERRSGTGVTVKFGSVPDVLEVWSGTSAMSANQEEHSNPSAHAPSRACVYSFWRGLKTTLSRLTLHLPLSICHSTLRSSHSSHFLVLSHF